MASSNHPFRHCPWLLPLSAALFVLSFSPGSSADEICAPWPDGIVCQPANSCMDVGVCQGGNCVSVPLPGGTVCRASTDPCRDDDICDGMGNCLSGDMLPAGTVCGNSPTPCQNDNVCNEAGQCVPGAKLPPGTICSLSANPCRKDAVCDMTGQCLLGAFVASGTTCSAPQVCRAGGTCDGSGLCQPGTPAHEGKPCIGSDICQDSLCSSGTCLVQGPRDCSGGNPCMKKDSCVPGVGCVAVNICDMAPPRDMFMPPDLMMSTPDLTAPSPDLMMSTPDLTAPPGMDLQAPAADMLVGNPDLGKQGPDLLASDLNRPARPDGGVDAGPAGDARGSGYTETSYQLPIELAGGACQCRMGRRAAPEDSPVQGLLALGLGLLLLVRRKRRLRSRFSA